MEESEAGRYWCYQCLKTVNPIVEEVEALTCPACLTGFVELIESAVESGDASSSDWSPVLVAALVMLRGLESVVFEGRGAHGGENDGATLGPSPETLDVMPDSEGGDDVDQENEGGGDDWDSRFAALHGSIAPRRMAILRDLRAIRIATSTESSNPEGDNNDDGDVENDDNNESSSAVVLRLLQNRVNETLTELPNAEGESDQDGSSTDGEGSRGRNASNRGNRQRPIGTFGDYFFGPNIDALMERLTEDDPNQYGTPPARKDAVEGLPEVEVEDDPDGSSQSCTVCLEELRVGAVVKEMPCKHRFHSECILPWLDLHSSCPLCRYLLPAEEESKPEPAERDDGSRDESAAVGVEESDGSVTSGGRRWVWGPFLWPV